MVKVVPFLLANDWASQGCTFHIQSWYYHLLSMNLFTCECSTQVFMSFPQLSHFFAAFIPTSMKGIAVTKFRVGIYLQKSMRLMTLNTQNPSSWCFHWCIFQKGLAANDPVVLIYFLLTQHPKSKVWKWKDSFDTNWSNKCDGNNRCGYEVRKKGFLSGEPRCRDALELCEVFVRFQNWITL